MGKTDGNRESFVASAAGQGCPSADALTAFSSGKLSEQELLTIADHVTHCTTCDETLRGLAADSDSLARRLREAVHQSHPVQEPGCLRMQAAAKAIAQRGQESATMDTLRDLDSGSSELGRVEPVAALERTTAAAPQWTLAPPLSPPASIGRFQIRSRLGQGGFGTVFLAHDPDLNRPVAIKVPKFADETTDESVRSFLEEARIAAGLKHPAIVAIYDVVRSEDKSCYIAMEYVEGESLKAALAQGKLPVQRAAQIIAQAASAAHVAHKKGLVHRDLKPGNILLDADGHVKIADFGLAVHEDQQRSRVGEKAGTVAYMSPEQVRGDVHRLDGRSDIWSLGVLLYEMLTGRRPFSGTPAQMRDEILHRLPRPLRQIDDTIPAELEQVCLKCLAKEADQRYSTAGDLAQALAPWQRGEVETAPRRRRPWPRWVRPVLVLAGCVLIACVAVAIFLPPEVPFRVDRMAGLMEPVDLLDRPPEEIFAKAKGEEHWEHRFKRHVRMDSPTTTLLGLGTTQSDWYRLQVRMTKSGPIGSSGLFLGLRRLSPEDKRSLWECQAITVSRTAGGPALVERELLTLEELPGRRFVISKRNRVASVPLDDPPLDRLILEVTVKGGQIADVRSQGKTFSALTEPAKISRWPLPPCQGRFGVTNSSGGTTFTDAKFESLRRPEP